MKTLNYCFQSEMKDVKGEGKFYGLECDLSNEQQVNNAFDWIKKNVKTIHVLINNAGIINPGKIAGQYNYAIKIHQFKVSYEKV